MRFDARMASLHFASGGRVFGNVSRRNRLTGEFLNSLRW